MQARKQFGEIMSRAAYQGKSVIIERAGKPIVAILPIDNYQKFIEQDTLNRKSILATMEAMQDKFADITEAEQDAIVNETVAEVRAELREEYRT